MVVPLEFTILKTRMDNNIAFYIFNKSRII
jgi:hypothetical protein